MKYTVKMIQAMPAGATMRKLAALGMGWHRGPVEARYATDDPDYEPHWHDSDDVLACFMGPGPDSGWEPDVRWSDAGRLLDSLAKDWVEAQYFLESLCCDELEGMDAQRVFWRLFSLAEDVGLLLAICRAFIIARLPQINEAIEKATP